MDQTLVLTQNEALAVGGAVGGIFATFGLVMLALVVLLIIGWWKLFTKAGEEGWKSIIPIYNIYIFCKIIGINFWVFFLAIPIGLSILLTIAAGSAASTAFSGDTLNFSAFTGLGLVVLLLVYGYAIFLDIYTAIKLGNAFNKSAGFKVGLVFLPNIFLLILAFGNSKYHKAATKAKD